jgi:DNA-binding CsgD family transcriptional regulator
MLATDSSAPLLYVLIGTLVLLLCLLGWHGARVKHDLLAHYQVQIRKIHIVDSFSESGELEREWQVIESLTRRELQVARLAAQGWTSAEIAYELAISKHTVGEHLKHIYKKLKVRSRVELVQALRDLEDEEHSHL